MKHETYGNSNYEWYTQPEVIKALGTFDLDPASPVKRLFDTATTHYTIEDDGLKQPWFGRCWLNPPYENKLAAKFMEKLADHGNGIACIYARTETKYFQEQVFKRADAILFVRKRMQFFKPDGVLGSRSTAPSVLIAYGLDNVVALMACGIEGALVYL